MAPLFCPICGKPVDPAQTPAMPFCSSRCREIDLGRWLGEKYAVRRLVETEPATASDARPNPSAPPPDSPPEP